MTATAVPVRAATSGEADAVAALLMAAFARLPLHHWLVPDEDRRAAVFRRWFRLDVDHVLVHGAVEVVEDLSAAALWLPGTAPPRHLSDAVLRDRCGRWWPRFGAFRKAMDGMSAEAGHARLALLAVSPDQQGRGLGPALLERRPFDGPVRLEAPSPEARRFYLRHGFTDGGAPVPLPGSGAALFPLVSTASVARP